MTVFMLFHQLPTQNCIWLLISMLGESGRALA